jgi:hypothetical protein
LTFFSDSEFTKQFVSILMAQLFIHRAHWSVGLWLLAPLLQSISIQNPAPTASSQRTIFDLPSMALVLRDALIETRPEFRYVLGQLR